MPTSETEANLASERIVTMRELSQNTSGVIREITDSGQTAFLTRHGHFIAVIKPLKPGEIERTVLGVIANELDSTDQAGTSSSQFVAAMNGLDVSDI